ncbi:hypothetical protein D3C71_1924110 [compost metagenome]
MGLGVHRDDPAVLRHVPGEVGGADFVGQVDDVLLVTGDQRAQYQLVRHAVDHRQVRQRLAGNLGDRLTGDQRLDLQSIGDSGRSA